MKKSILVGTHHKTGTKWFIDIFRSFGRSRRISYHDISVYSRSFQSVEEKTEFIRNQSREENCIFFDANSRFQGITPGDKDDFVGIHIIRDPRDVIISATHYHQFSNEEWLHIEREELGGMSYQGKMNSLGTLEEKLEFEMNHTSKWVIKWMNCFKSRDLFRTYKYENLIEDSDLVEWRRMAGHLGLNRREARAFLKSVQRNSLFGERRKTGPGTHIRSGRTKQYDQARYRDFFRKFDAHFPGVLRNLGYDE